MNDVVGNDVATVDVTGRERHDVAVGDRSVGGVLALCREGAAGVRINPRPMADGIGGVTGGKLSGLGGVTGISRLQTPCTKSEHITN